MLYYTEFGISLYEVPDEYSVCIYISGCTNHCKNCHYPELQQNNYGILLKTYFYEIIDLYVNDASCVCFLGEGNGKEEEISEFIHMTSYLHSLELKSCLYSGKYEKIQDWMQCFDYVKVGKYIESLGTLYTETTNQKMFQKTIDGYIDITYKFRFH